MLAAAGRYALRHNVERLADDHDRAARLAAALGCKPELVETNIVVLPVPDAPAVGRAAREQGVIVSALGPKADPAGHPPRHRRRRRGPRDRGAHPAAGRLTF